MIQRIQSLCLFFSGISSLVIIYSAPIFEMDGIFLTLNTEDYQYAKISLLGSAIISIYTIFQFKNRKKQSILTKLARLLILTCIVLIFLKIEENMNVAFGFYFLLIPFLTLLMAGYFIRKDEKLVKSADRIR